VRLRPHGAGVPLLLILGFTFPVASQQSDFEAVGIRLITPEDPGFLPAAKALNVKDRPRVAELLSNSIVIENRSKRSIVLYAVVVTSTDRAQQQLLDRTLWSALNAIALQNEVTPEIRPGRARLVSPFFTLASDGIFSVGTMEETRSYIHNHAGHTVKVQLDAVVFEDGEFVGPDRGNSFPEIEGRFAARREIYSMVVSDVRRGVAEAEVLNTVKRAMELASSSSWHDRWLKMYARELLRVSNARSVAEAFNIAEEGVKYPLLHRGGNK
jgi:hypothetical protein